VLEQIANASRDLHHELGKLPRRHVRRIVTTPPASTRRTEKVLFAKSIPSAHTEFMGLPLSGESISQTQS
jgi:hypothetical protein